MKTEDFERIKKLCDENGFELVTESPNDNDKFFVVKKKDEWEGVEFVEYIGHPWEGYNGNIFKVISISDRINVVDGSEDGGYFLKQNCKPSTKQAYVEQLKKEAKEKFGDILDELDFFKSKIDRSNLSGININESQNIGFTYFKHPLDSLYFNGLLIYEKGKWAERVKERVKIKELHMTRISKNWGQITFKLSQDIDLDLKCGDFISQQLEKYLNNEI